MRSVRSLHRYTYDPRTGVSQSPEFDPRPFTETDREYLRKLRRQLVRDERITADRRS